MPTASVIFDRVAWFTGKPGTPERTRHFANRGDEVDLPQGEYDRLLEMGAIGTEDEAQRAAETAGGTSPVIDEELRGMTVDQVVAYIGQNPDELDRVETMENEREQPRKGVMEAIETAREAQTQE